MGDIRPSDEHGAVPVLPENEVRVLVTGFGPFLKQFPINPSHEIAKALPTHLTIPTPRSTTTLPPSSTPSAPSTTRISITAHPTPIKVAYAPTHAAVPALLAPSPDRPTPDLVLHIGLAAGRSFFAIEKSSAKYGYDRNADVDGLRWAAADSERAWKGVPERLETGLAFDAVWEAWRKGLGGLVGRKQADVVEVRPSDDVGSYLCGFIYFNSLAWFWQREGEERSDAAVERPVLFLHVPACPEERDVERGRDITIELIKAMVATWLVQKEKAAVR
ncbi:hypothetical protein B0J12DRAFT_628920 [Macrophomina phaseolina]|uniref:Peptidase C15 pyroglutamyl peptidase I-like protein n=1 Tax=Macrophomina phaseolina TaxID=35725 RepID=A0ABQ8G3D5_9PEZI|nr:hypothetical protein B0J12DRAFT_628920 [Macrophomina phaseolina]